MVTKNRVSKPYEEMRDQAENVVTSHPLTTVATAFGLGLIVGAICMSSLQSIASRAIAESIGHRIVDKLAKMTPSSWSL
jgi:hypothetical protein